MCCSYDPCHGKIFLENQGNLKNNMVSKFSFLFSLPQKIFGCRFLNTIDNARSNISAHYDISNAMFAGEFKATSHPCAMLMIQGFLSEDMTYSSAIFADLDSDLKGGAAHRQWNGKQESKGMQNHRTKGVDNHGSAHPDRCNNANELCAQDGLRNGCACSDAVDELYEAQMTKLDHIIKKAKIQEGDHVLEIGSGWGSMAIRIAQRIPGTTIDAITLSSQQQDLARRRIAAQGLSDRITVHLMDYRSVPPEWEGVFDRIISIEMLEHAGKEYFNTYWKIVDWALKPQTGAGVVQVITIPEASTYELFFFSRFRHV